MSSKLVATTVVFPDLLGALKDAEPMIEKVLVASVQTNRGMLFANEGSYNGHERWAPLKHRNGQILADTGTLKNSIAPSLPDGNPGPQGYIVATGGLQDKAVVVGTRVAYAAIHNYGGRFRHPGTDNGFGKKIRIRQYTIEMPRRNFTEVTTSDREEFETALANIVEKVIDDAFRA